MAGGAALICCSKCNRPRCADASGVVTTTCTGWKYVRTQFSFSGSAAGSASSTTSIPLPEDAFSTTCSASWSANFNFTGSAFVPNDVGQPLAIGISGYYQVEADGTVYSDTLSPFGTVSGTASGSATISDLDGTSRGGGSFTVTRFTASFAGHLYVEADGTVSTSVTFGVGWGMTIDNPLYVEGNGQAPKIGYGVSGSYTETTTGTIDPATLCAGATVTSGVTGGTVSGSSVVTPSYYLDADDDAFDGDSDGGSSVSAHHLPASTDESSNPLTGQGCARALAVSLTQTGIGNPTTGAPNDTFSLTGRVTMREVIKCGQYYLQWFGPGACSYSDGYRGGRPLAVDLSVDISPGTGLCLGTLALQSRGWELRLYTDFSGPPNFTFRDHDGNDSAPMSFTGVSASDIRAAIEAFSFFASRVVRVFEKPSGLSYARLFVISMAPDYESHLLTVNSASGAATLFSGLVGGDNIGIASYPFTLGKRCPDASTIAAQTPNVSITLAASSRIAGDPNYYCDCPSACDHSAVTLVIGGGVTLSLTSGSSPEADDPCVYLFESSTDYYGQYRYNSDLGRFDATLYEATGGALALQAHRYCNPGGSLGPLVIDGGTLKTAHSGLTAEVG